MRQDIQNELYSTIVPYFLRAGVGPAIMLVLRKCLGGDLVASVVRGTPQTEQTPRMLSFDQARQEQQFRSWNEEREKLGYTMRMAVVVSVARIVAWHLLQPLLYALTFYCYSDEMVGVELILGFCVLLRELIYTTTVFIAIRKKPAVFLYSPKVNSLENNIFYIAMPEKFILWELDDEGCVGSLFVYFTCACDICALAALILAFSHHRQWGPLMIGYGVTAVSGIVFLCVALRNCTEA